MPSVTLYASIAGTVTVACGGQQLTLTPEHADALIYPMRNVVLAALFGGRAEQQCAHYQVYGEADTLSLADLQTKRMIFLTIPGAINAIIELPRFAALARLLSSTNHAGHPPPQVPQPPHVRTITVH
jgi:hypothetical protein